MSCQTVYVGNLGESAPLNIASAPSSQTVYTGNPAKNKACRQRSCCSVLNSYLVLYLLTMQQPAEAEVLDIIFYLLEYAHLLCKLYRSVVPYATLYYYLYNYYKIQTLACKAIVSQYKALSVSQTNADIVPLLSKSSLLDFLALPKQGYFCLQYNQTTCSQDIILLHFQKTKYSRGGRTRNNLSYFL